MANKIAVITDSTSNINLEQAKISGITIIPLQLIIDEKSYEEFYEISFDQFLQQLVSGKLITTSQPTIGKVLGVYEELLKTHDHIIYITISSLLSGTYQSGILAAEDFKDKVTVIDSLSTAYPLELFTRQIIQMVEDGKTPQEIASYFEIYKSDCEILLMPETLTYLRRGGRIDAKTAMIGNLLGIKPILKLKDGVITSYNKTRAFNKGVQMMIKEIISDRKLDDYEFFILHVENETYARKIQSMVKEEKGIDIEIHSLPAVITTHVGPNTVALGYAKKYRRKA